MNDLRFVAAPLAGGKKGILKPDGNGYYSMYVGALNVFNSQGWYYPFEAAKHIFLDGSSEFQRRVKEKALRGEVGHPKLLPGMTEAQFFARLLSIYEENICVFFKEIQLDFENCYDEKGNKVVGILASLKPDGKQAHVLQRKLDDPEMGACFSIRSFTKDYPHNGTIWRAIRKVVTFDDVNEGGVFLASKKFAPGLEDNSGSNAINNPDIHSVSICQEDTRIITQGTVEEAIRTYSGTPGLENGAFGTDLLKELGMSTSAVAAINKRAAKAAWDTW